MNKTLFTFNIDKLRYEQYGLNDFYWALDKQNKKQANSANKNCKAYQGKQGNSIKITHKCGHQHQKLASTEIDSDYNIGNTAEENPNFAEENPSLFKQMNESSLLLTLTSINIRDVAEENPNFKEVKVLFAKGLLSLESQKINRISP